MACNQTRCQYCSDHCFASRMPNIHIFVAECVLLGVTSASSAQSGVPDWHTLCLLQSSCQKVWKSLASASHR